MLNNDPAEQDRILVVMSPNGTSNLAGAFTNGAYRHDQILELEDFGANSTSTDKDDDESDDDEDDTEVVVPYSPPPVAEEQQQGGKQQEDTKQGDTSHEIA
mmetsp:Transcript_23451/g.34753  ORF Transcript_23451/g.34753 Transcript_23451/m.34753 type:complete len:101 (-) Transcript_23451:132-434(-)